MAGKELQVVFSFDTTGSMAHALEEVRKRISDMVKRILGDKAQNVTVAIIAHGDYCDRDKTYVTKHIDFTNNLPRLVNFVNEVQATDGGDTPEAYEVMLREVRRDLSWTSGSQRVLCVVGDTYPHPPDDPQNTDRIDWKVETRLLADMGVRIYGVQVGDGSTSRDFFRTMTEQSKGFHLTLDKFQSLCDVLMAVCYREKGQQRLHAYEQEVRERFGPGNVPQDLEKVFGVLREIGEGKLESQGSNADVEAVLKKFKDAKLV